MSYTNDIREIRKMINESVAYNDNYAHKRTDEELQDYVTYFDKKDTGLSKDIIVDTGGNYKFYNHPLCLYVVGEEDNVYPVTVSMMPKSIAGEVIPIDITMFIQNSIKPLFDVADMKIDGFDFMDYVGNYKEQSKSNRLVGEMSILAPQKTGLSVWVYVDDTKSYLTSGHNGSYRIKFQQDKDVDNPRLWMPMLIPSLEIMNNGKLPACKISQKDINNIKIWAKGNSELLEKLKNGEINGMFFKKNMKTLQNIEIVLDSEINNK